MRKKVKEANDAIEVARNEEAVRRNRKTQTEGVEIGEARDPDQGKHTNWSLAKKIF